MAVNDMTKDNTARNAPVLAGTVAEALANGLVRHGVKEVFGQSLPSALILAAMDAGIRQISYRTENAGGAMADGFARISHRVGVVTAQNGPAATLLVPPLSEAMTVAMPVVALVQEVPRTGRDRNAFQQLDHFALFDGCAKWIRVLDDPARAEDYLDMAFVAATTGRPGPAVLLLPKDVLREPAGTPLRSRSQSLGHFPLDRPRPAAAAVEEAAALLARAKRPVIVAGGGVIASDAAAEMAALQDMLKVPVATTIMGKGSVNEEHPLSLGVMGYASGAANSRSEFLTGFIADADVVFLIGSRTNENATDSWRLYPPGAQYIHLDADGCEIGRNYEALRLVGDAKAGLADLTACLKTMDLSQRHAAAPAVAEEIASALRKAAPNVEKFTLSDAAPLRPERVMHEIDKIVDADTIVVTDASYSSVWMANFLTARHPGQRFVAPRGLAGLGWGLPLALGAKAAEPAKKIVCIVGDGAFAHVWSEMETSVRSGLPVVIVLLNNGILGYQKHAELYQFAAYTSAIHFAPVDHVAVARACGARGTRIDHPKDLPQALAAAQAEPVTTLIEVMTSPHAYPLLRAWDGHADALAAD